MIDCQVHNASLHVKPLGHINVTLTAKEVSQTSTHNQNWSDVDCLKVLLANGKVFGKIAVPYATNGAVITIGDGQEKFVDGNSVLVVSGMIGANEFAAEYAITVDDSGNTECTDTITLETLCITDTATYADNLTSWEARGSQEVIDEWSEICRTTAGSMSIDSSKKAYILRLESKGEFKATSLFASGVNLLNPSQAVDSSFYFQVPKMLQGSYGTSDEANGILFVNNAGDNIKPDVRFSTTKPTSENDGTAVTPYQFSGHDEWFYKTSQAGWFIVKNLGVSAANACARIAWSKDYNVYVAYAAGSSVNLASAITALVATHNLVSDKMLAVGNVADVITFDSTTATWLRKCSAVAPTWSNETVEGGYKHTATIPSTNGAMKNGGYAELIGNSAALTVDGVSVSYTDENATSSAIVKYELSTPVSGTISQSNEYQPNDMGVEALVDGVGDFMIRTSYYQEIPDAVFGLLSRVSVVEENEEAIDVDNLGNAHAVNLDLDNLPTICGFKSVKFGTAQPTIVPEYIGQEFIDTTNKKVYISCGVSASSDWKALN